MAISATFNDMIKTYMPISLLNEELKRRNWLWNNIEKDESYYGGTLDVPFEGAEASSLSYAALTDSTDVSEATYVLGTVTAARNLWGTMVFNELDLDIHKSLEQSFLKIIPNKIDQFVARMSEKISLALLNGNHIDTLASNGANGSIVVYHPERFSIGEKIFIKDNDTAVSAAAYITAIDMNTSSTTGTLTIMTARGGAVPLDASAYSTAQDAKVYLPNADTSTNIFTNLKGSLLSATNGGTSTLYGQTKTTYPYLQAKNISGAAFSATNILDSLYNAYVDVRRVAKGQNQKIILSYKHMKNVNKILETGKQYQVQDRKIGYGFNEVTLLGIDGPMTLVAVNDIDDDFILILDMSSFKFYGHDFFNYKRYDNNLYWADRKTTGYKYYVDVRFFGELIVHGPCRNGIIHSIPLSIV